MSPDVEKQLDSEVAADSTMAGERKTLRRLSPPSSNTRKYSGSDEHGVDNSRWDRDKTAYLDRNRAHLGRDKTRLDSNHSGLSGMRARRGLRLSPRAAYGWLHQQSGYIFLLVVFLAFLRAGLHAAAPPSPPSPSPPSIPKKTGSFAAKAKAWIRGAEKPHPIPALMDAAETRFRAKVGRQSPSLAAAVAEYTRRYARAPPRGFDLWYEFALKHNFVMIDEFDSVHEDLKPFWELSGEEMRERARLVGALPSIDLVRVRGGKAETVKGGDGKFKDSEVSARAAGFKAMLGQFVKQLPDMDFPINAKAEGRVVVPWEHVAYPNTTEPASTILSPTTFRPDWAGAGSVWDAWRRTCPPASPARRLYSAVGSGWKGVSGGRDLLGEAYREDLLGQADSASVAATENGGKGGKGGKGGMGGKGQGGKERGKGAAAAAGGHPGIGTGAEFAFAKGTSAGLDFCGAPGAHYEQGHFFSDWRVLPALVPVFSPARARGFGDIRVPSHYYYGGTKRYTYAWDPINLEQRAVDPMEVPWEAKRDVVWWRGASTGGGSSPPGFGYGYQRHRFLRMSSVGLVRGTLADAQRTTPVTFAVPPQPEQIPDVGTAQAPYSFPTSLAPSAQEQETTSTPVYTTVPVPLAALNADVMDTAFTKAVVPIGPEHRFGDSTELGEAWGYKYLLDLDGMGYSGRFMAFLASDSVPVKSTVYDEFFTGWIEPWLHYIPISVGYSEIYNIVSYFSGPPPSALRAAKLSTALSPFLGSKFRPPFTKDNEPTDEEKVGGGLHGGAAHGIGAGDSRVVVPATAAVERPLGQVERRAVEKREGAVTPVAQQQAVRSGAVEEGDRRLRRIARAGKQWKQTIGRKVDMEVYVYRLALEYARLWADDRDAMSYTHKV